MAFWDNAVVATSLSLVLLLLAAESLRRWVPGLARLGLPGAIIAGVIGLGSGPQGVALLPLDAATLESIVYHGLGIVFIAVGLQPTKRLEGHLASGVRSFSVAIPFMITLQTIVGLLAVLLLGLAVGTAIHPGLAGLLPLGFEEGPGQALALGTAWEQNGLADGAQIGLIIAALGYAWSVVIGVPLVAWGRRRGLISKLSSNRDSEATRVEDVPLAGPGALDLLTRQVVAVGACYALTFVICLGLSTLVAEMPDIASTVWGFHFIIGAGVAMAVRPLLGRLGPESTPLHGPTLGRIAGLTVDVMTCAALAAIQLAVLGDNWLPIALITTLGGGVTLVASLWLASRAFPDAPFEHAVVWFGMSTGTLPMGLALLRIIDPELKSPAPVSAVIGSAGAIALAAPAMIVLIPGIVATWPESWPLGGWAGLGIAVAYLLGLLLLWRKLAPLKFERPLRSLWWKRAER